MTKIGILTGLVSLILTQGSALAADGLPFETKIFVDDEISFGQLRVSVPAIPSIDARWQADMFCKLQGFESSLAVDLAEMHGPQSALISTKSLGIISFGIQADASSQYQTIVIPGLGRVSIHTEFKYGGGYIFLSQVICIRAAKKVVSSDERTSVSRDKALPSTGLELAPVQPRSGEATPAN